MKVKFIGYSPFYHEIALHQILCIRKPNQFGQPPSRLCNMYNGRYNFRLWVGVAILTMLGDVHKRQQKQSKLERHSWQTYLNERQKCNQFYLCLLRWVLLQFLLRAQPLNGTPKPNLQLRKNPEVQFEVTKPKEKDLKCDQTKFIYLIIITKTEAYLHGLKMQGVVSTRIANKQNALCYIQDRDFTFIL